jgi:N-acetylmuramoyl-L-alanine amidase
MVALQISLKLGDAIKKMYPDINIIYTRTTDILPGNMPNKDAALRYRSQLANESHGDLFLCIHCNSAGYHPGGWWGSRVSHYENVTKKVKVKKKWVTRTHRVPVYEKYWIDNVAHGTETYVWATGKNDDKKDAVGKNQDYTGEIDSTSTLTMPDPNDPTEKARILIYTQNYFRKSLTLADNIQKEFEKSGRVNRGVKQRNDKGIWVLHATAMPSVLVETGFISNTEEEKYLNSDAGQAEIVKNILAGFTEYKEKYEQKANLGQRP